MSPDDRMEIVEGVHKLMDLLDGGGDEILLDLCEQMLERLDVLAAMDMEGYK